MESKDAVERKRYSLICSVSLEQYQMFKAAWRSSICRSQSEYIRRKLMDQPITVNQRNQSFDDFMAEMILLRKELNAIVAGVKTNTVIPESLGHLLLEKISEIKLKINQINDQWLQ